MIHAVIGLGEVGNALKAVLVARGKVVEGLDLGDEPRSSLLKNRYVLNVCFPFRTPGDGVSLPEAQQEFVDNVTRWVDKFYPGSIHLIVVHSTVAPGTTNMLNSSLGKHVVHSPINGKHNSTVKSPCIRRDPEPGRTMEAYIEDLPKWFGGPEALKQRVLDVFASVWDKIIWLGDARNSELMKLLATTYYAVNISWVQLVKQTCDALGTDYDYVTSMFRELPDSEDWRVDTKFPGYIGGHCLIPNLRILTSIFPDAGLQAILDRNKHFEEDK